MPMDNDDLFDDVPVASGEGDSKTFDNLTPEPSPAVEPPKTEEPTGDKPPTEPPSVDQEGNKEPKAEKMIPESRLKAALKDVTEKLDAAQSKLAEYEKSNVPDKEKDPEGYDLHLRMEASKLVMREAHTDYDEVIAHYVEMAKVNPKLNEAVAEHKVPAWFAYKLAKEDMELQEVRNVRSSDDWKQFQEWKKKKAEEAANPPVDDVSKKLTEGSVAKVPNLNRATSVSKAVAKSSDDDDELFKGAL